jgi:hypothetical protein
VRVVDMLRLASEAAAEEAMSSQPAVEGVESDTETAVYCCRTQKAGRDVVKRENNVMQGTWLRQVDVVEQIILVAGRQYTDSADDQSPTNQQTHERPQRPVAVSLGAACCCDAAAAALRAM